MDNQKFDLVYSVFKFNREVVGIKPPKVPCKLDPDVQTWLCKALSEECKELSESHSAVDQVDALVDSIIFAVGGLTRMGLSEQQVADCMHAVMTANFSKKAGVKAERATGDVQDAIKPEGWVPPEARIAKILNPYKKD